jgi:hypothetical protein
MIPITDRRRSCLLIIATSALCTLFTLSCLVPISDEGPREPFQFSITGTAGDTVSPFGPLVLRFTHPVSNPDSVRFIFSPSFTEYLVVWSRSHDTARLTLAVPLEGNATYRILPANRIVSTGGVALTPGKDSITFATRYCEKEPNNPMDLADTLRGTLFGRTERANDTDWFVVSAIVKREFYLKSTGSASSFAIRDGNGVTVAPPAYASAETLSAPIDFVSPLYLKVFPYNHSNGGTYELGWTGR